jgi:hypothetical protein
VGIEKQCIHLFGGNAEQASGQQRRIVSFNVGSGGKCILKWLPFRLDFLMQFSCILLLCCWGCAGGFRSSFGQLLIQILLSNEEVCSLGRRTRSDGWCCRPGRLQVPSAKKKRPRRGAWN